MMAVAVVTTAEAPSQARASESGSVRSPEASSAPIARRYCRRSAEAVGRTSARTGLPALARRRQTSLPSAPVAPTTRIIVARPSGGSEGNRKGWGGKHRAPGADRQVEKAGSRNGREQTGPPVE